MLIINQITSLLMHEREAPLTKLSKIIIPNIYIELSETEHTLKDKYAENNPPIPKGTLWLAIHNIRQLKELREHKIYLLAREAQTTDCIDTTNMTLEEIDFYEAQKRTIKQFRNPNPREQLKQYLDKLEHNGE